MLHIEDGAAQPMLNYSPADEGKYKAAAIYDPTPYCAGTTGNDLGHEMFPYSDDDFDYDAECGFA